MNTCTMLICSFILPFVYNCVWLFFFFSFQTCNTISENEIKTFCEYFDAVSWNAFFCCRKQKIRIKGCMIHLLMSNGNPVERAVNGHYQRPETALSKMNGHWGGLTNRVLWCWKQKQSCWRNECCVGKKWCSLEKEWCCVTTFCHDPVVVSQKGVWPYKQKQSCKRKEVVIKRK